MRIVFQEHEDFKRYAFADDSLFLAAAQKMLVEIGVSELPKQRCCITALLPFPRSNVWHEVARQLGNISWVTYAEAAEFRPEDLTRYFLCYPPKVLIGSDDLLSQVATLSPSCFIALEHVVSVGALAKIGTAQAHFWDCKLCSKGIESHVD